MLQDVLNDRRQRRDAWLPSERLMMPRCRPMLRPPRQTWVHLMEVRPASALGLEEAQLQSPPRHHQDPQAIHLRLLVLLLLNRSSMALKLAALLFQRSRLIPSALVIWPPRSLALSVRLRGRHRQGWHVTSRIPTQPLARVGSLTERGSFSSPLPLSLYNA